MYLKGNLKPIISEKLMQILNGILGLNWQQVVTSFLSTAPLALHLVICGGI